MSFTLFLENLLRGGRLDVESNWGGLGGGLSGWRVSGPLAFLFLSIGLFALLVAAISNDPPHPDLWERYRGALNFAAQNGIKFEKREVVGGKLLLKGTAPSQAVEDAFWTQVKLANPLYDDIVPDLSIKAPAGAPGAAGVVK
ncbi:hypothetical protein [Edaphobacter aggregans]|uniref:hypothetical protein n=1 Tax=Edaphobacter aggregans TaxID=570835 RepID=UPI000F73DBAB|nr:hypothetical protein [Edaphobacter aggregans]